MKASRWLTAVGIFCLFIIVIMGCVMIADNVFGFGIEFIFIGILLSFIIIGLGEILYHLQKK